LTAIGNDLGFEQVFARQMAAVGAPGDAALALSTSGQSVNVLAAVDEAKRLGITTIGLTGSGGGALATAVDVRISVPSTNTARLQESHILIAHIVCELVELQLA
jgi:D-sedoheptulose 7-phosphate isomerase